MTKQDFHHQLASYGHTGVNVLAHLNTYRAPVTTILTRKDN